MRDSATELYFSVIESKWEKPETRMYLFSLEMVKGGAKLLDSVSLGFDS